MASTYSDLKIELIATGEQSGTWGTTTNTNLGTALEEAIVGRATANFTTDADLTLTLTDTNATQVARHYILNVTSGVSLSTTRNLIVPTIDKPYIVENNTTGGQSIVVKTSAGTGVTVPNGKKVMVYANSTDVVAAQDYIPSLSLGAALPVASGGTGQTSYTDGQLLIGNTATSGLTKATITQGSGISITNGNGSITIASTTAGMVYPGAGIAVSTGSAWGTSLTAPTGTIVGTSDSQTLTNKTISGADNTVTVDGTNAVGFRTIPQNSQSTAYTLVLADSGKHILHPSADTTARTFTIPANSSVAFPIGTAVTFINQNGAGVVTIAITTDTMRLAGAGTTGSRTLAANGVATAIKLTSTEWIISGTGLT